MQVTVASTPHEADEGWPGKSEPPLVALQKALLSGCCAAAWPCLNHPPPVTLGY